MAVVYDDFLNQSKNYWDPKREEAKAKEESIYGSKKQTVTDIYNKQSDDTSVAYEDAYRDNTVQKFINEREVAENMANLGLTDSGLNRTQQTAIQLSYANNKAKINRQKPAQLDTIAQTLATELSAIEQEHLSNVASIDKEYDGYITSTANDNYSEAVKTEAEIEKARINAEAELEKERISTSAKAAENISKFSYGTSVSMSYGSNGNIIYTDESGNSVKMRAGANPYTGEVNSDLLVNGEYDASRAFSNGYQPRYYKGKQLTGYTPPKNSKQTSKAYVPWREDGKQQQIFTTGENKYYAWYGPENRYVAAQWNGKCWEFNLE